MFKKQNLGWLVAGLLGLILLVVFVVVPGVSFLSSKLSRSDKDVVVQQKEEQMNQMQQKHDKEIQELKALINKPETEKKETTEVNSIDQKKESGTSAGIQQVLTLWGKKPAGIDKEAPIGIYDNGKEGYATWINVWDVEPAGTDLHGDQCFMWVEGAEGKELWVNYKRSFFTTRCGNLEFSDVNKKGTYIVLFQSSAHSSMVGGVEIRKSKENVEYYSHKMEAIGYNGSKQCGILWADFIVKKNGKGTEWWCAHWFTGDYGPLLWADANFLHWDTGKGAPNWDRSQTGK